MEKLYIEIKRLFNQLDALSRLHKLNVPRDILVRAEFLAFFRAIAVQRKVRLNDS
jgi:hypothetical protein